MSHRQVYRIDPVTGKGKWHDIAPYTPEQKQLVKKPRDWKSQALGCHPDQRDEFNGELRKAGISSSAYYDNRGDLVIEGRDRGVRNAVMNLRGVVDLDGCYGDRC